MRHRIDPLHCVLLLLVIGTPPACAPDPAPEEWPVQELRFPAAPEFDYSPMRAQAHAALPAFDTATGEYRAPGRVWLKGSEFATSAAVGDAPAVALEPPFYTACADAPPGPTVVTFSGADFEQRVEVVVPDALGLNAPRADFSIVAMGCFDPFWVYEGEPRVNAGDGTGAAGSKPDRESRLWRIRELLLDAVQGKLAGFPVPDLVCGSGDQVYVEPSHDNYGEYGTSHPLSAWTIEPHPRPRIGLGVFYEFLDQAYRCSWSFKTLDEVLRLKPSVLTWDDHEIRDGWGSHGDEHVYVDTYYAAAREAFVEHQFLHGPRPWSAELSAPDAPLHQRLALHGLPIFVMDQRSARDARRPQVLGDPQWADFSAWMAALDPAKSPYYVLVSPLPVLYRLSNVADLVAEFDEEVADDVVDSWGSDTNVAELDRLVLELLQARKRGCRALIISGDMHMSALLRAAAVPDDGGSEEVFAYELVTSGLAGQLGGGAWKQYVAREGLVFPDPVQIGDSLVRFSLGLAESSPNFGGIEFEGGQPVAHMVQATPDGGLHYRVPLQWGRDADDFEQMIESGLRELSRGTE